MKHVVLLVICLTFAYQSCTNSKTEKHDSSPGQLSGTWKLLQGTLIEKGDTSVTDYTKGISFIKMINDSHFAFLQHDLTKGKGPSPVFVSGGGTYSLNGDRYSERLEYCSAREWEGNTFEFKIKMEGDTLIQEGTEKVPGTGTERVNIEKYVRLAAQ